MYRPSPVSAKDVMRPMQLARALVLDVGRAGLGMARAAEAASLVGDATYRLWRLYMAASARSFSLGDIGVVQMLLARPDACGSCSLPTTRHDIYRSGADRPDAKGV